MDFSNIWTSIVDFYYAHLYVVKVLSILLGAALLHFLTRLIYRPLHKKLQATHHVWDDALTHAIYWPIRFAIWMFAFFASFHFIHIHYNLIFFHIIETVFQLAILASLLIFFVQFARELEGNVERCEKRRLDLNTIKALSKIYYIFLATLFLLAALRILGIPLSAVIAFGGVGGLAVGFAAKDFLANLFGGLMIFIGRPFGVGDWIRSPDRSIEGAVEQMGWRQVRIRTAEKRPIYVPNSLFSTIVIENVSRMDCRKIVYDLALRYDDIHKVDQITTEIESYISSRDDIDASLLHFAKMVALADSWLTIKVTCFAKTKVYVEALAIQQELFIKSVEIIEKCSGERAFPTQTQLINKSL